MFDQQDGCILGEGAGAVLIETEASALERQVETYVELLSFGYACDAKGLLDFDKRLMGFGNFCLPLRLTFVFLHKDQKLYALFLDPYHVLFFAELLRMRNP